MIKHYTVVINVLCLLLIFHVLIGSDAELEAFKKNYKYFGLDNENICHPFSEKVKVVTELRKFKDYAIIVEPSHVFNSWQVKDNKQCKFKIKGPKEDNLFAVVQRMSLRRIGTECLDYVMFQREESNDKPKKFCGKVVTYNGITTYISGLNQTEIQKSNNDYLLALENKGKTIEEFSTKGKITTEIFISKQQLKTGESLDLVITYTPYKDCNKVKNMTEVWSDPNNTQICISKKFVCDGYVNCVSSLCNDDYNCSTIYKEIVSNGIGVKIMISAVTTMFLCLIIFAMCFWICKIHKILCWSQDFAGPSPATVNTREILMVREGQSATSPPNHSTASMLEGAVPSFVNDRDLPPSYDSLFPTQTNAVNA